MFNNNGFLQCSS